MAKEGVNCTREIAKGWIDGFYTRFRKCGEFIHACHAAVTDPGFVANPWGRERHFPPTDDNQVLAAFQREAGNFPIQSTVGDAMSEALKNLCLYRQADPDVDYRIVMSIHDAVRLEVPAAHVPAVVEEVLPICMSKGLEVPGCGLHYSLGEIEVQERWGEKTPPERLLEIGVPRQYCGFKAAA